MKKFLTTIGMEVEGVARTNGEILRRVSEISQLAPYVSSVTHDASVESACSPISSRVPTRLFLGSNLAKQTLLIRDYDRDVAGYEVVSVPLEREEFRNYSVILLNALTQAGEIFSPRSSIHFHVGFPSHWNFSKSIIAVGMVVEPLMFKLAGMTREYRGSINNSAFARSFKSPPAVKIVEGGYAVLSPEKALKARTPDDFWASLGVITTEPQRYHPARYFSINVLSQLLRGTVEFRHCNFYNQPFDVIAVGELCQSIAELMFKMPSEIALNLPFQLDLFRRNSDDEYHNFFDNLLGIFSKYGIVNEITPQSAERIHNLINKTPQPILGKEPTLTHLEKFRISSSTARAWGLPRLDEAKSSGVVTVHNFGQQERSLI